LNFFSRLTSRLFLQNNFEHQLGYNINIKSFGGAGYVINILGNNHWLCERVGYQVTDYLIIVGYNANY
jgi:hypothetical protein